MPKGWTFFFYLVKNINLNVTIFIPESKDKRCFTPIHCASLTGNADCISTLLDGGSEVNSRGFAGATPLHITVRFVMLRNTAREYCIIHCKCCEKCFEFQTFFSV